jgi:hypothetical protein
MLKEEIAKEIDDLIIESKIAVGEVVTAKQF